MRQLSQRQGISRRKSIHYLCTLLAFACLFWVAGCTGVAQQTTPPSSPQISVVPSSIVFNNVVVGQKSTQTVQISNVGQANLTVNGITLTGNGFALSSIAVPFQLAPSANKTFTITFTASSTTSATATLTISSDDPGSPLTMTVQGNGQAASASWQMSPTSIAFSNTTIQTTQTQNASIKNNGNVSVTISSVSLTGAAFSTSGLSNGMTLSAGQQVNFQVLFHPTAVGSATGSLSVASSSVSSPLTMNLTGSGVNAPTQHTVTLNWNSSGGVAGFNIYRSLVSGGPYSQLNSSLDATTSYVDSTVASGKQYFYVTTAVDSSGAESGFSNEASATIPNP
jgi:hypothetical protein